MHIEWNSTEQGLLRPSFDVHTLYDLNADSLIWDIWKGIFFYSWFFPDHQLTETSCQSYRVLLAALTLPDMASHGVCWELLSSVCTQLGNTPWTGVWRVLEFTLFLNSDFPSTQV